MCSFILIRELLLREMLSRSCMPRCVVLIITTKWNEDSIRVCIVSCFVCLNYFFLSETKIDNYLWEFNMECW